MMTQKSSRTALLACTVVFSFGLAGGVWAADVNKLVESCANCHGKDGASSESDVPTIAGFSSDTLASNLTAFKKNERPCPETKIRAGEKKDSKTNMCKSVKDLSDGDIKQLADYYAGKKFVRATQKFDPALAKKGKAIHDANCDKCHGEGGSSAKDDAGILAGQWMPYLE
ncbi:MAG: c-type cytochrome, partial [Betaproteobacteria bacterium]